MAAALLAVAALSACSSSSSKDRLPPDRRDNPFKVQDNTPGRKPLDERELRLQADQLYKRAHDALNDSDYATAITRYDQLNARYPFSDYATQADMEKIFAQYKAYQPDDALAGADRFLRAHPRTAQAEYIQYLKGVINFSRDEGLLSAVGVDDPRKDVGNARRAFGDFALLIQRYPNSRYAGDARRRMIWLRNRIADHEMSIVRYYLRRGAYVAASKRAQEIIVEYPGAPATAEALKLLGESDRRLGLKDQAQEVDRLVALNGNDPPVAEQPLKRFQVMTSDTANVTAAPVLRAEALQTPAPAATTPAEKPGFFGRVFKALDVFDTSKPENQYVITIPTGAASSSTTTTEPAKSAPVKPATEAASKDAKSATTGGSATTAPAAQNTASGFHGLHVEVGAPDDDVKTDKSPAPAPPPETAPAEPTAQKPQTP